MANWCARPGVAVGVAAMLIVALAGLPAAASGNGLDRIAHAEQAVIAAGSAGIAGQVSVSGATSTRVKLSGVYDFKHGTGRFSIDGSALGVAGVTGNITFLLVGHVVYLSVSSLKNLTGGKRPSGLGGKRWLKIDETALGAAAGGSLSQTNPASTLDFLRGATTNVQDLGATTVHGASTTHYQLTLDLAMAVQKAPPSQRAQVQQAANAIGGSGTIPAGVWIDAQGRVRRFTATVDVKQATGTARTSEIFEYSNFGAPVRVTAPPPSEVLDISQYLGGLGSGLGGANSSGAPSI